MSNRRGRPRPARRRVALALLALGAALGAPAVAAATPGAQIDLADVGDRPINLASTFTSESLVVTNTSTAGEGIATIAIDLADGPAMFPDLVFDPAGGAGDTQGKDVTLDSVTGIVVLANPPAYRTPVGGGYAAVIVAFPVDEPDVDAFGDFAPGSAARFSFDVDPTSIQGTPPDPVPAAAPVSGAELHGATVAVAFSDGSILAGDLVLTPGTDNSSHLTLAPGAPLARPTLARAGGRAAPAVTFDPSQEITVTGPAGATGVMVVAEGHLNVVDAPGGGTDLDPFEANTAAKILEFPFTIGPDGIVSVPVTLSDTPGQAPLLPLESGINSVTAYLVDGERTGPVSDPLVIRLDPEAERVPPAVADVTPVEGATGVALAAHVRVTFSEPMDPGTVMLTLAGSDGIPIPAEVTAGGESTEFTLAPDAPLTAGARYTATVGPAAADAVGNPLGQAVSWSFSTEPMEAARPAPTIPAPTGGQPACAAVPPRPAPTSGGPSRLTVSQLRIDQRTAQAALRRAAAIESWLAAGIVAEDLCGDAFGPAEFTGVTFAGGGRAAPVAAAPRPLAVASQRAERSPVALSAAQLRVNQRIAQAALRRVAALEARLDAGLTGGDLADGAIAPGKLWTGLAASAATAATPVAKTETAVAAGGDGAGRVRLTVGQLRINQRIARAAVRRVNALADRLARGLTGADFRDGTLSMADLAPEVRPLNPLRSTSLVG